MQATSSPRRGKWQMAAVLIVVAVGGVAVGRALVRERKVAIERMCDEIYVEVNGEIGGEITPETQAWIATWRECFAPGVPDRVSCAVARHADETNPRNRLERAYTSSDSRSCQVQITTRSTDGVCFTQFARLTNRAARSYCIRID